MSVFLLMFAVQLAVVTGNVRGGDDRPKAQCTVDLIFLDDGSTSICEDIKSCPNWQSNLRFIEEIIRYLNVDVTKSRVAYLKYGPVTDLRWDLDAHTSEKSLLQAVSKETIPRGELTSTKSFEVVPEKVFTPATVKEGVRRVGILITDDANITDTEAIGASNALQAATGLKMMMVCLNTTTSKCHAACAAPLSSYPHQEGVTYFMSEKYSEIDKVRKALEQHICVFQDPPKAQPTEAAPVAVEAPQ